MVSGPPTSHRRKTVPLWLWLLLPVIVIVGLGVKLSWDIDYASHREAEEKAREAFVVEGRKRFEEIAEIMSGANGKTKSELEQELGVQQPLPYVKNQTSKQVKWIEPNYSVRVEMIFDADDNLVGNSLGWGTASFQYPPYTDPPLKSAVERLGRLMCPVIGGIFMPVVYVVWIPLMIAYFKWPDRRGVLSYLLVSWAVICPLVWLMSSYSLLSFNEMSSYDANGWGVIMFVVTAIVVALGGVRDWFDDQLACPECGYSLRGNTTGQCPECGSSISAKQQRSIQLDRS